MTHIRVLWAIGTKGTDLQIVANIYALLQDSHLVTLLFITCCKAEKAMNP